MSEDSGLRETALHAEHVALGGRMVPFAGYEMPVQYGGILSEARAVRSAAGMFDVSHMGRFFVEGRDARALLDWAHTADIGEGMPVGRARYGLVCNEDGGIIDDALVYRLGAERYLIVANAANAGRVWGWLEGWRAERFREASLADRTGDVAMIALQGPDAVAMASRAAGFDAGAVRPFRVAEAEGLGEGALVARTGYTGEDGVEFMPSTEAAVGLWRRLLEEGAVPCGLGARDTLRLEAGLLLHGSDMDEGVNPVEAGLERFVNLEGEFCGGEAVREAALRGTGRRLAGFRTEGRGPSPRAHAEILGAEGEGVIGLVTSGGYSPSLDTNVGLGYVPLSYAAAGTALHIDVRGRRIPAWVVPLPFYSRPR